MVASLSPYPEDEFDRSGRWLAPLFGLALPEAHSGFPKEPLQDPRLQQACRPRPLPPTSSADPGRLSGSLQCS